MNVVTYRKYVVPAWTPVVNKHINHLFRNVYSGNGTWIINGHILVGWSWKNIFRPVIERPIALAKHECQIHLMCKVQHYKFRRHRRLASLIFVNNGVPIMLAEIVAEYV